MNGIEEFGEAVKEMETVLARHKKMPHDVYSLITFTSKNFDGPHTFKLLEKIRAAVKRSSTNRARIVFNRNHSVNVEMSSRASYESSLIERNHIDQLDKVTRGPVRRAMQEKHRMDAIFDRVERPIDTIFEVCHYIQRACSVFSIVFVCVSISRWEICVRNPNRRRTRRRHRSQRNPDQSSN